MTDFQQDAVRLAAQQQSPDWLAGLRQQAAEDWLHSSWPTRKTEHWKYTPLLALQKDGFTRWAQPAGDWH
ncbi:MAG TPA: Fe-S cluster assembly protein SufD, partial [Cellvibrio sp.]|nr:Fe-S cluster assembly protein SufD [Cellvibrio sp.]